MPAKCLHESNLCKGTVKKRPILRYNGRVITVAADPGATYAYCDRCYRLQLNNAIRCGKKAVELKAALDVAASGRRGHSIRVAS